VPQRLAVLAATGPATTKFHCREAPRDGRSPPTGWESEECRLKSFEPIAEEMAKLLYPGAIRLVEFTGRRDLREIKDEDQ
jgi:hypothetical protein